MVLLFNIFGSDKDTQDRNGAKPSSQSTPIVPPFPDQRRRSSFCHPAVETVADANWPNTRAGNWQPYLHPNEVDQPLTPHQKHGGLISVVRSNSTAQPNSLY